MAGDPGFYVDVGCGSPVQISNTFLFYCIGWQGLAIDANDTHRPSWENVRPADTFVHAAVAEQPGQLKFYVNKDNWGMSMVSETVPSSDDGFDPAPREVPIRRLDDLFEEYVGARSIQIMSIDIEGGELSAFKSNNWQRWCPELIIIECGAFDFAAPYDAPTVSFLRDVGYRLSAVIHCNVIMVRD